MPVAESLVNSMSYTKYRGMISSLLEQGKSTGHTQSDDLLNYSKLNEVRMNRYDKKMVVLEEVINKLMGLKKKYVWLLITEGWCGDAAHIVPVINKLAAITTAVDLKIVLRDENEGLMNMFLTNGNKAVPILVVLDETNLEVLGNWGPRPEGASNLITSYKRQYGKIDDTAKTELQLWYNHDKGQSVQQEIADLMVLLDQMTPQKH